MSTTTTRRAKSPPLYPMNEHNALLLGTALSNVWNSIAPDLDRTPSVARWGSKRIAEVCLDYLGTDHLSQDDGLGLIAYECLSGEHGHNKVMTWIAKEYPLSW